MQMVALGIGDKESSFIQRFPSAAEASESVIRVMATTTMNCIMKGPVMSPLARASELSEEMCVTQAKMDTLVRGRQSASACQAQMRPLPLFLFKLCDSTLLKHSEYRAFDA
eukprot:TRINITY_DN7805_c0_g1_i1.p1 TRINITY_DN7805_c0_g1~~TRINITY_DN7805_c0_g1_i1.p1  ORF type:complete len:111 (+),score=11.89 TRINITY_DN7805_c0_g1_i1:254-586(+)